MTVGDMRSLVAKAYNGDKWKNKVRNMPDDQIVAIYYKMASTGKIQQNTYDPYKNFKVING